MFGLWNCGFEKINLGKSESGDGFILLPEVFTIYLVYPIQEHTASKIRTRYNMSHTIQYVHDTSVAGSPNWAAVAQCRVGPEARTKLAFLTSQISPKWEIKILEREVFSEISSRQRWEKKVQNRQIWLYLPMDDGHFGNKQNFLNKPWCRIWSWNWPNLWWNSKLKFPKKKWFIYFLFTE